MPEITHPLKIGTRFLSNRYVYEVGRFTAKRAYVRRASSRRLLCDQIGTITVLGGGYSGWYVEIGPWSERRQEFFHEVHGDPDTFIDRVNAAAKPHSDRAAALYNAYRVALKDERDAVIAALSP
jgi:hypothetical protein